MSTEQETQGYNAVNEEMPRLYFNEYFRRKPDRLSEREQVSLFTLEPSNTNNVEYVFAEPLLSQIAELEAQNKQLEERVGELSKPIVIELLSDAKIKYLDLSRVIIKSLGRHRLELETLDLSKCTADQIKKVMSNSTYTKEGG